MLKEKSIYYYNEGFNCTQCLLKAFEYIYKIPISEQSLKICNNINNGFGVGNICGAVIAGIMIFSLLFDYDTTNRLKMELLFTLNENHSINCMQLKKEFNEKDCTNIIGLIADIIENIINNNLKRL